MITEKDDAREVPLIIDNSDIEWLVIVITNDLKQTPYNKTDRKKRKAPRQTCPTLVTNCFPDTTRRNVFAVIGQFKNISVFQDV